MPCTRRTTPVLAVPHAPALLNLEKISALEDGGGKTPNTKNAASTGLGPGPRGLFLFRDTFTFKLLGNSSFESSVTLRGRPRNLKVYSFFCDTITFKFLGKFIRLGKFRAR